MGCLNHALEETATPHRRDSFIWVAFRVSSPAELFFLIVKVVANGALVRARDFFLAQGALGVRLRGHRSLLQHNLARSFNADSLQSNARHRAARGKLPLHLVRPQRRVQVPVTAVRRAAGGHVRTVDAGIVPTRGLLAVVTPAAVFIRPGADAAAGFAAIRIIARLVALAPTLAGADGQLGLVQSI